MLAHSTDEDSPGLHFKVQGEVSIGMAAVTDPEKTPEILVDGFDVAVEDMGDEGQHFLPLQ